MATEPGFNPSLEDLTAEIHKRAKMLEEAERVAQLGSWEWNFPSGEVVWSEGVYRLYGLTPETFGGTFDALLAHVHPDDRPDLIEGRDLTVRTGQPFEREHRIIRSDGATRVLLSRGEASSGGDARVSVLGVSQDVTERKQMEEALRQHNEQLQALDQLKTDFVNAVSHELRTPLTTALGYLELLEEGVPSPLTNGQQDYVQQIKESTLRLESLVNDLLDVASLNAGTFKLAPEPADLRDLVQKATALLEPQFDAASLRLDVELPASPLPARFDSRRIEQVLLNLVGNAIKFSHSGGTIAVRACRDGDRVRCEVADHGIGIALADQAKLFQRFGQLHAGASKGGTGLGLWISKSIIEAHGGAIGVESRPGKGSTFWFTLPAGGSG
jgi:PAS domain S-box-containing protein